MFPYLGRPRGAKPRATAVIPLADVPRNDGRMINFSVRAKLAAADPSFTTGFAFGGVGTGGVKPLPIRAVGPSLAPLGTADPLPDPAITVMNGKVRVAANDNWYAEDGPTLSSAFIQVGAFPFLSNTSRDAAVLFNPTIISLASYTIEVRGNGTSGVVLAELCDAIPKNACTLTTPRLINFSVLKQIAVDENLTTGLFIGGATSQRVLVRAVGPTLGTAFGVGGAMANPKIELFDSSRKLIASNRGWDGGAKLATTIRNVGAFKLPDGSTDAVVLIALPPVATTCK
ncbi:MAG: hypothetical protein RL077_5054 [Verrucomicrobiota bacterium]|jgi:hypothetical protein